MSVVEANKSIEIVIDLYKKEIKESLNNLLSNNGNEN